MSQSCIFFELRAKANEASSKKGVAGSPGNKTPNPARITHKLPKTMKTIRMKNYQ
jgi:hypothetical protein